MASQLSEYNKGRWAACFRRVDFMACQLYRNKKIHGEGWMVGSSIQRMPAMRGEGLRQLPPSPAQA